MKYNPAFLGDEALIRSFVARHHEFELVLEVIRENTGDASQHVLIIGPRGSGKTTLALRTAAETGPMRRCGPRGIRSCTEKRATR